MQVLQSKYLRIATGTPWYTGYRQIYENFVVPHFCDHSKVLAKSLGSHLACAEEPLVRQLGGYLCCQVVGPQAQGNASEVSGSVETKSTERTTHSALLLGTLRLF